MSSSMPRTTPAWTRSWASWRGGSDGPVAYTSAPSTVTPTADRHCCSTLGTECAHDVAPQVFPQYSQSVLAAFAVGSPLSTSGIRFWRTPMTSEVIDTSLPHAPTLTVPFAKMTRDAAPVTNGTTTR